MSVFTNKLKLTAVSGETQEHTRYSQSQKTFLPESTEKYITQILEEIEGRVTKKLSQEFSRTSPAFWGSGQIGPNSFEHSGMDALRNRSGNIPEQ